MSTVACFYVVGTADVPALAAAGPAGLATALRAGWQEIDDEFFWPGEHLLFVIEQLWHADRISLFSAAFPQEERMLNDDSRVTFLVGAEHKELLPMLVPSIQDSSPLTMGLVAKGVRPAEARLASRDAVTLLYQQIDAIQHGEVLVIHVS